MSLPCVAALNSAAPETRLFCAILFQWLTYELLYRHAPDPCHASILFFLVVSLDHPCDLLPGDEYEESGTMPACLLAKWSKVWWGKGSPCLSAKRLHKEGSSPPARPLQSKAILSTFRLSSLKMRCTCPWGFVLPSPPPHRHIPPLLIDYLSN